MGFSPKFPEIPTWLLCTCFILSSIRRLVSIPFADTMDVHRRRHCRSAGQIPVFPYRQVMAEGSGGVSDGCCAVCLREFAGRDKVRRPDNCRHVFHRQCLDRWTDQGRWTCPLCRAGLVPEVGRFEVGPVHG